MTRAAVESRPLADVLDRAHRTVDPALRAAVDTLPATVRRIAGYHLGWWDADGKQTTADGGKGIRPALVLLSAEAVGGEPDAAVPVAVAVALTHDFSLIHDDVMDRDRLRRHRPTAWSVFGIGGAILAGDALLALACDVLAASGHPSAAESAGLLSAGVLALIDGQCADLAFESRSDVSVAECIGMSEHKTGALVGCASALGALFGGGSPDQVAHLRSFGQHVGLAFQHVDDLLGIWGDPAVTGKPVYSDLRNRKKSLPVVAALASAGAAGRALRAAYTAAGPPSDADLGRMAELIERAGGRAWSQAQVGQLLDRAFVDLESAGLRARPGADLAALARLMARRDH